MTSDLFPEATSAVTTSPAAVQRLMRWSPADWPVHPDWQPTLDAFWRSPEGLSLGAFVQQRLDAGATVYPRHPLWALQLTPLSQVKVVILGQDPYHGPHQAQGLSFSVAPGVKVPPSLRNIFKELQRDLGQPIPASGSLEAWAKQGVLLLNTSLTVEDGLPASHAKKGWESLTDALLMAVARSRAHCVYMLWGGHAQAKVGLIQSHTSEQVPAFVGLRGDPSVHRQALVLTANHPSPLSALRPPQPFMGCGHFSVAKKWLHDRNIPLSWSL